MTDMNLQENIALKRKVDQLEEEKATNKVKQALESVSPAIDVSVLNNKKAELERVVVQKEQELADLDAQATKVKEDSRVGLQEAEEEVATIQDKVTSLEGLVNVKQTAVSEQIDTLNKFKVEQLKDLEASIASKKAEVEELATKHKGYITILNDKRKKLESHEIELNVRKGNLDNTEAILKVKGEELNQKEVRLNDRALVNKMNEV